MKMMRIITVTMFVLCAIMSVEAQEETPTLKSEGIIPQTAPARPSNVITIPQVKQLMPVTLDLPQKNSAAQTNEALSRRIDELQGKLAEYKTIATTLATIAIEARNSNNGKREAEQALLESNERMADSMDRSAAVAERAIRALQYTIAFAMVIILVLLGAIAYIWRKGKEEKENFERQLRERAEASTHQIVAVVPQQLKRGLNDIHATVSRRPPLNIVSKT